MASGTLLERDDQRDTMLRALRDARHGGGRVLAIEGAAGIGKSRLLGELRAAAGAGQRVLAAQASELERDFAYGVVRQLFEGVIRDDELRERILTGSAAATREIFDDLGQGGGTSFALLHGLYWLTLNLADDGPLVLCVDDLHWCDTSSLRFLGYLARRLDGTDVLLATATRPVPVGNPDASLLADLLEQPTVEHLFPQALSPDGTRLLLEEQLGREIDPLFARACHDATDGNPLMLRQLGRSLQADGTAPTASGAGDVRRAARRALSRTVLARAERLSTEAVGLARAVAVLGDGATVGLAATIADLRTADIEQAWGELVDAEILRHDALAFVHALVRDAMYLDLPEPARERLHRSAATALESGGASAERVASHLHRVHPSGDDWVAGVMQRAGEAALRHGDPDAAATHLRRALAEPAPDDQRQAILGPLAAAEFDVDAVRAVDALQQLIHVEADPRTRVEHEIARVQALALTDRWNEASEACRMLEAQLGDGQDDQRAMLQAIRSVCWIFGAPGGDGIRLREHRELPPEATIGERMRTGQAALMWAYDDGTAADAGKLAGRAVGTDPEILRAHTLVAVAPLYIVALADGEEGMGIWEQARADAHRRGSVILHITVDMWLGIIRHRQGDLAAAISGLGDALAFAERWNTGLEARRYAVTSLATAYLDAGDVRQARAQLAVTPPHPTSGSLSTLLWWHAHASVLLAEGRPADALDAAEHLRSDAGGWMRQPIGFDWNPIRAAALHRLGRSDEAMEAATAGVELGRRWGAPGVLGPALRVHGEVSGAEGLALLEESVAVLDGSPSRLQLARSLLSAGAARRRAGDVTASREPLERALELARACGSPGLTEAARVELAAAGVRRKDTEVAGAAGLTPSERRVADLAAEGRTNRAIAQELFVTPKTVEVHLSAAYRKLGISSRRELPAALSPTAA